MSSNINTSNIDANFPVAFEDNSSQGFRDNFFNIKANLDVAASEITDLQNTVSSSNILSKALVLASYTTATLAAVAPLTVGAVVYVTDAPGGAQPCFYDGTRWYTFNGRVQI